MRRLVLAMAITFSAATSFGFGVDEAWRAQMQQFKTALGDLLPYLASNKNFNDPQNALTIQSKLSKLSEIRNLLSHSNLNGNDPTMAFLANAFEENISAVEDQLSTGRRDYARYLLMNTTSYCIECHTRTPEKPEFFGQPLPSLVNMMGPVEKVEYLIAGRQFREAMTEIEDFFKGDKAGTLDLAADKIARYGLIVSVRYFQDPKMLEALINRIEAPGQTPIFLQRDIKAWRRAVGDWKKAKAPPVSKVENSIKFVESLIRKANKENYRRESDHAGDIFALRAYSLAGELLKQKLLKAELAKVLMLMGDSHIDASEALFWTLPRFYYEACIKVFPHTVQAGACYDRFEADARRSYSNSMAMIPLRLLSKMKELKVLSELPSQKN